MNKINPQFPIYIISKGRHESRLTSKALEEMNVPYRIVIEPQEYDLYASVIDPKKILVLNFSNLGQGSIPARNWVWEHSISEGHRYHWILDDNIRNFLYSTGACRIKTIDGYIFKLCEDFVLRFKNIKMSGMNYKSFNVPLSDRIPPYYLNTRIYSCILLDNTLHHRWRGKYNEDTDLSLRVLKDGHCTLLFNSFLCDKMPTMKMKGGNTEEVYNKDQSNFDNRKEFVESLIEQHPDVVKMTYKWGRNHHQVDYTVFANNKLIPADGYNYKEGVIDNKDLVLVRLKDQNNEHN